MKNKAGLIDTEHKQRSCGQLWGLMKPVGALAVKRRLAPDELYYSMGRKQGERQERILLCGRNGRQRRKRILEEAESQRCGWR